MKKTYAYKSVQEYLNNSEGFLQQNELENNLVLGICYALSDKTKENNKYHFINVVDNNTIQATSISTIGKAIIISESTNEEDIKLLPDYYIENKVNLNGVHGKAFYANTFSTFYDKKEKRSGVVLVHELTKLNDIVLTSGKLEKATDKDIDHLTNWALNFQDDAKTFPKKSKEEVYQETQRRIEKGDLYKWIDKGEVVSIAAIVRKTKNFGIIGLVYTPDEYRGRGYATSCVYKLSEHIIKTGFKSCGLFTDKSNPTSNSIYRKIGYIPRAEFKDIEFA